MMGIAWKVFGGRQKQTIYIHYIHILAIENLFFYPFFSLLFRKQSKNKSTIYLSISIVNFCKISNTHTQTHT